MRRHTAWAWYVAVVVLTLVVVAVLVIRSMVGGDSSHDSAVDGITSEGADLSDSASEAGGTASAAAIGQRPDCPRVDLGLPLDCLGGETTAEPKDTVVVNVWAWWCPPCREELPVVEEFAKRHPEVTVVGVHADPDAEKAAGVLDDLGVTFPSFEDSRKEFAATNGLPGVVPVTLVLRADAPPQAYPQVFRSVQELESVTQ